MCTNNQYDQKLHLEFIQNVITRMASNSFMCKGWSITLFAALMVIDNTISEKIIQTLPITAVFVLLAFWFVDSYYLHLEKLFRDLYNEVRKEDYSNEPYSMKIATPSFWSAVRIMFSISECPIYMPLIAVVILVYCNHNNISLAMPGFCYCIQAQ